MKSTVFWPYCRGRAFSCAGLGTKALRRPGSGRPCWEATSSLTMLAAGGDSSDPKASSASCSIHTQTLNCDCGHSSGSVPAALRNTHSTVSVEKALVLWLKACTAPQTFNLLVNSPLSEESTSFYTWGTTQGASSMARQCADKPGHSIQAKTSPHICTFFAGEHIASNALKMAPHSGRTPEMLLTVPQLMCKHCVMSSYCHGEGTCTAAAAYLLCCRRVGVGGSSSSGHSRVQATTAGLACPSPTAAP